MKSKVPVQKGPIHADVKTSKMMTHQEKLVERSRELNQLRDGQTLKLHTPK